MNPPSSRNTLLVSGLPVRTTVDAVMGHFCQWGQVARVLLAGCGELPGAANHLLCSAAPQAALVEFTDPTSVDAALQSGRPHLLADQPYRIERYRCLDSPASPMDCSPRAQVGALRARCGQLQQDNQQLAEIVTSKDKATRLLLGNVEAWRQKFAWYEKKRADDLNRLQAVLGERQRSVDQLNSAAGFLRQQLEERRAADLATHAGARWQLLLERENSAMLAVLHGKSRDMQPVQQLVATLNSANQETRAQEAENSRLAQVLAQKDALCRQLAERLEEGGATLDRLMREGGGQQRQLVRALTAERDQLRAELMRAVAGFGYGGVGSRSGEETTAATPSESDAAVSVEMGGAYGGGGCNGGKTAAAPAVFDNYACFGAEGGVCEMPARAPLGPLSLQ